jgi:Flp pilus assembly pilin Flp
MMENVLRALDCINGERGQGLAEYSLILAFVAMACILALGVLGLAIAGHIDSFAAKFPAP